ncbi:MAG: hypothetical protein HYX78_08500 [Armatimonadetes bacterium]|nr:hypothetical protein [Armatimonadota bacterium]
MASLIKKTIKGHQYYYARECRRVGGKPKIVWQKYLGRADDIVHALTQATSPSPQEANVAEFGLSSALFDIADKLGLVQTIDRCCPKREQGASVGAYMLLAAINRCSRPTSKNKIAEWYASTTLRRLMPVPTSALTSKKVFGKEHVVCLTWSEELYRRQMRGLHLQLSKRITKLKALQAKLQARYEGLVRTGRKPTVAAVARYASGVIKGERIEQIISYSVTDHDGQVIFDYSVNDESLSRIAQTYFGKNILFTDRQDMDAQSIVDTYHAQYKIEDAFKQMKDPHHVSFWPIYHWTDQKIRVHAFYCVLALTLSSLLSRRIEQAGLKLSPAEVYEQLSDIKEVLLVYPRAKGKPKVVATTSGSLATVFGMNAYSLVYNQMA